MNVVLWMMFQVMDFLCRTHVSSRDNPLVKGENYRRQHRLPQTGAGMA
jgi:hypothetical protein